MVKRMASRYCTGMASRVSFMIKKELPQMKAAAKSMGLASFFMYLQTWDTSFVAKNRSMVRSFQTTAVKLQERIWIFQ